MENYEKKYKQALKRAKTILELTDNPEEANGYVFTIFPELHKSEDERIRKELISFITDRKNWFPKEETKAYWIAWLEKQDKTSWIPDKEEMGVLYDLCYISCCNLTDEQDRKLTRLYQDLKRVFFNGASFENMFPVDTSKEFEKQDEQKPTDKVEPKFKKE